MIENTENVRDLSDATYSKSPREVLRSLADDGLVSTSLVDRMESTGMFEYSEEIVELDESPLIY